MKKVFVIIGIIIVIAAISVGIYFGWKKSKEILTPSSSPSSEQTNQNQNTAPQSGPKLRALSKEQTVAYWPDSSYENIFYLSSDGKIFKTTQDSEEAISEKVLGDVKSGEFSNDGKFVLAEISSLGFSQWNVFDLDNKNWQILPTTVTSASFSSNGKKVVYLQNNVKGFSDLFINDAANFKKGISDFTKKQTKILSLAQEDFKVEWLNDGKVLLISRLATEAITEVWAVDLKAKIISKFLSGAALATNWSKNGDLGAVFSIDGNSPRFSLFNSKGIRLADFGFYTFPQKCFIASSVTHTNVRYGASQTNMFCAVPTDQPAFNRVRFFDEYLKRGVFTKDNIVQLDLVNNKTETVFMGDKETIDANSISFNGSKFLFINRYDNRLYSLEL